MIGWVRKKFKKRKVVEAPASTNLPSRKISVEIQNYQTGDRYVKYYDPRSKCFRYKRVDK